MLGKKIYLPLASLGLVYILGTLILGLAWDLRNYGPKYQSYNIGQRSSISPYESKKIVRQTMDYLLRGQEENIISNYYKKEELSHLGDLRKIFIRLGWLKNISGLVGLGLYLGLDPKEKKNFQAWFLKFLGLVGLGLVSSLLYFRRFFYLVHSLIFRDRTWLLDRRSSILIQFMPEVVFRDLLVKLILVYTLIMIIIFLKIYLIDRSWKIRV